MSLIPLWQIDAFADQPFSGNPAAVCLLRESRSDGWMQRIAAEMNLAETAFLQPLGERDAFQLRWFTPTLEVDLCGHATIAAAWALAESALDAEAAAPDKTASAPTSFQFETRSGRLSAEVTPTGVLLDFPSVPVQAADPWSELIAVLGDTPIVTAGRTKFDWFAQLESAAAVRKIVPDLNLLARQPEARGLIVTALSDQPDADFISRFFAPGSGVDEDPVTGSAHCSLAPFWSPQFGRSTLFGYQASPRGGKVQMEVTGNRVKLSGKAVTVFRGELSSESAAELTK